MKRKRKRKIDIGLLRAIRACGNSEYELAKRLHINVQSVYKWKHIPFKRIVQVEKVSGVRRELLAPRFYR